jgi:hypothetical protein
MDEMGILRFGSIASVAIVLPDRMGVSDEREGTTQIELSAYF